MSTTILLALLLSQSSPELLRAVSWNIYWDNPNDPKNSWVLRRDQVAEVLISTGAHVIGLQEAEEVHLSDLTARLAPKGFVPLAIPTKPKTFDSLVFYRPDRLTLFELRHLWLGPKPSQPGSRFDPLPGETGFHTERSATCALFGSRAALFWFCNTHLGGPRSLLERQAQVILEALPPGPAIFTGDFNTFPAREKSWPTKPFWVRTTTTSVFDFFLAAGFSDVYGELHPQDMSPSGCGWTGPCQSFGFPARVDWVLQRGMRPKRAWMERPQRPEGRFLSDHFPVVVDLVLPVGG